MELKIDVGSAGIVSGLLQKPLNARACYAFAHGAGAGMTHSFMGAVATGLFDRDIATLRYQFPYMQKGSKRTDSPSVAHAAVRAAVAEAGRHCPELPLFAGGKSFGGRMTSQAQALIPSGGGAWSRFFRLSAPSGRKTLRGAGQASIRYQNPDALLARRSRQISGIVTAGKRNQRARKTSFAARFRVCRPFVSCTGAIWHE